MKKREFLETLRQTLSSLPLHELEKQLNYYEEMLNDMIEDGMSEEEATSRIGDPVEVGRNILADMPNPPPKPMQPPKKTSAAKSSVWIVIALILGFPIWFSVGIAALSVVIAVLASVLALLIAAVAVVIALVVGGFALIVAPFFLTVGTPAASVVLLIGTGLLMMGLGFLFVFGVYYLSKGLAFLTRKSAEFCSAPFKRRKTL